MPNNHSNTDVVGPEILACSGGHSTHQFAPPSVEKFGLENARKAFANASKISHPVTTRAAGNRFMLATDEHVVVDSGGEECISAGNIWRVSRLDREHDPVMVTEVKLRTRSVKRCSMPALVRCPMSARRRVRAGVGQRLTGALIR